MTLEKLTPKTESMPASKQQATVPLQKIASSLASTGSRVERLAPVAGFLNLCTAGYYDLAYNSRDSNQKDIGRSLRLAFASPDSLLDP